LALAGVQLLPLALMAWQLVHVAVLPAAWFIKVGAHAVPIVWQLAQVFNVIGATVCAFAPAVGRPVALVPLWQVVQLSAAVTPV
jgi:hypothetical protein